MTEKKVTTEFTKNYKLIATTILAIVAYIILIAITVNFIGGNKQITYMICLFGFILGWIVAIFTTPYDKSDETQFERFAKLVGTFFTGYILSKLDTVFEKIINPNFILTSTEGGRMLLFFCYFGLTWIVVFAYRQYTRIVPNNTEKKTNE